MSGEKKNERGKGFGVEFFFGMEKKKKAATPAAGRKKKKDSPSSMFFTTKSTTSPNWSSITLYPAVPGEALGGKPVVSFFSSSGTLFSGEESFCGAKVMLLKKKNCGDGSSDDRVPVEIIRGIDFVALGGGAPENASDLSPPGVECSSVFTAADSSGSFFFSGGSAGHGGKSLFDPSTTSFAACPFFLPLRSKTAEATATIEQFFIVSGAHGGPSSPRPLVFSLRWPNCSSGARTIILAGFFLAAEGSFPTAQSSMP